MILLLSRFFLWRSMMLRVLLLNEEAAFKVPNELNEEAAVKFPNEDDMVSLFLPGGYLLLMGRASDAEICGKGRVGESTLRFRL